LQTGDIEENDALICFATSPSQNHKPTSKEDPLALTGAQQKEGRPRPPFTPYYRSVSYRCS